MVIIVYLDDMLIAGNNQQLIQATKDYFHKAFKTKDLGELQFFSWNRIQQVEQRIMVNQRKYALGIISE